MRNNPTQAALPPIGKEMKRGVTVVPVDNVTQLVSSNNKLYALHTDGTVSAVNAGGGGSVPAGLCGRLCAPVIKIIKLIVPFVQTGFQLLLLVG